MTWPPQGLTIVEATDVRVGDVIAPNVHADPSIRAEVLRTGDQVSDVLHDGLYGIFVRVITPGEHLNREGYCRFGPKGITYLAERSKR